MSESTGGSRAEPRRIPGDMPVRHRYTPGVAGAAFLDALRERGVLLGSRCGRCSITYVPARLFCERCFDELAPDAEAGPGGVLESWTLGHVEIDGEPSPEPLWVGLVRLDGADTVLLHRLVDLEDRKPSIGMRVEAVVRSPEERTGSILDVRGFRPAVDPRPSDGPPGGARE